MDAEFDKAPSSSHYPEKMLPDNTSGVFSRHTDSVLCCAIDNRSRLVVSGGIDDTAYVWDLNTTHVIFECVDHKESVVAAAFSVNSTYVATGDLNGYIQVRNTTTGIKVFEYEIDEINWIIWHSSSDFVLIAGTAKGDIWMWNVNDPAAVKTFPSCGSSCTTAKLLPDAMRIAAGYSSGALRIFDLKSKQSVSKLTEAGNSEIITIDLNPTKPILAVGCLDSSIKLLLLDSLKVIGQLYCKKPAKTSDFMCETDNEQVAEVGDSDDRDTSEDFTQTAADDIEIVYEYSKVTGDSSEELEGDTLQNEDVSDDSGGNDSLSDDDEDMDHSESVESIRFSPCGEFLAASNNSGTIIFWDVSSQVMRCERHTMVGVSRAAWTNDGFYVTGCLDGKVRMYDINLSEIRRIDAHSDQVLDLALRERVLVSASEDKTCRVTRL